MAKKPVQQRVEKKRYFVFDDNIKAGADLGGIVVKDVDGKPSVYMSEVEAQYWIQQGTIGLEEATDEQKVVLNQVFGRKVDDTVNEKSQKAAQAAKQKKSATETELRRATVVPGGMPPTEDERKRR